MDYIYEFWRDGERIAVCNTSMIAERFLPEVAYQNVELRKVKLDKGLYDLRKKFNLI